MGVVARRAAMLLGGVAWGVLSAHAAQAQAVNPNARNITLLERLVIGAGAPKVAIDTPQSVTVVDQADIDQKQAGSTGEIFDDMPGITMIGSERVLGESFNIRGIGAAETSGDEARIIITVDGAKKFYEQYRMGSFFSDPELYKRVEVLRGPASSTLYGSGAFGGVINFTTKDASDFIKDGDTGAIRVKGQYTSNGNGTLTSAILAHRINETFEVLATGNFRRSDLQMLASGGTLQGSEFKAWSGLVKGTMYLEGDQVVRLSYQRWNSDADKQDYAQTGTIPTNNPQNFGLVDRSVDDQTTVLSYENPGVDNEMLDLKMQLSYSDTAVSQDNPTSPAAASSNIFVADYGYKTIQGNVQNTSTFTEEDWVNYITYGIQASYQTRVASPATGNMITTHPEGTSTAVGAFVQSEQTWSEKFTLIAGVRGDLSHLVPSTELATGQIPGPNGPNTQYAISPKVAALYRFNDNLNIFGSAAHTERMPTLDEMYQYTLQGATTGNPPVANPNVGQYARTPNLNLKKEYSNNFEVGFSTQGYDLLTDGDGAGFKATAFYNDITDGIRSNPVTSNGNPYFINISGMRIWGLELEGSYENDMMFARLAYTFTRGEYTKPVGSIAAGSPIETIPQDKVVLTVGGRVPEQDIEYGTKITVAANPISAIATVPATAKPGPWATVDLFASWKPTSGQFEGLEAQFSIENLFNQDYRENLSMDRSRARTFKLTLAKQIGY